MLLTVNLYYIYISTYPNLCTPKFHKSNKILHYYLMELLYNKAKIGETYEY